MRSQRRGIHVVEFLKLRGAGAPCKKKVLTICQQSETMLNGSVDDQKLRIMEHIIYRSFTFLNERIICLLVMMTVFHSVLPFSSLHSVTLIPATLYSEASIPEPSSSSLSFRAGNFLFPLTLFNDTFGRATCTVETGLTQLEGFATPKTYLSCFQPSMVSCSFTSTS